MGFDGRRRRMRHSKLGSERELTGGRSESRGGDTQATSAALVDRILETAGTRPDSRQLMRAALEQLREWTGCEAAAIRLEEAGDYPYVIEQGFPAKYLATDNSLLSRGPDRSVLNDNMGRPVLECACGDIIRGRNPSGHPRFTADGTFWTGSAGEATPYDDRGNSLSPLRGRCKAGGYESVACVPLKAHGEVFGVLQLNSKRKHLITPQVLEILEPAVTAFAMRLREQLADEAVRSSEALHEALSASMVEAFAYCRLYYDDAGAPNDWAYVAVNDAFLQLFEVSDPVAKRNSQVMPEWQSTVPDLAEVFGRVVRTRRPERLERHLSQLGKWLVMRVSNPTPDHFLVVFEDISERKQVEERLLRTQFSLDNTGDYPLWVDVGGRIVEVSESTCRHLEYTREELLSMTIFDIDVELIPDDWSAHWDRLTQSRSRILERRHRTKSGRVFPVEVSSSRVSFGGEEYNCGFCRDISKRWQVEEKLRRAQFTLDHIEDYPMWLDSKGRIVEVSDSTCRHLEYMREELLSMTIFDIDPLIAAAEEHTSPERRAQTWEQSRERGTFTVESKHRTKSGREYPVEVGVSHVILGDAEYQCSLCRDISERKQIEERLQRTQFTMDAMTDYPMWVDSEARIVEVSESTCRHLEYTREELLSMTVFDIDPAMDRDEWVGQWEARHTGSPRIFETEHRAKSGRLYPVEVVVDFMSFGGQDYSCGFCRDVSERKEMEEKLRRTQFSVDNMTDYLIWGDAEANIVDVSESTCRHLEYTREELLGMTAFDIDPGLTPERWAAHVKRIRQLGSETVEIRHRTKSGRVFPVEVAMDHVFFGGQEYDCSFCRDISERKQAEEKLLRAQFFLDHVDDYPMWTDIDARIVDVSETTCRHLGYTREELLSMTVFDIDPAMDRDEWVSQWEARRTCGPRIFETQHLTKSGRLVPVEVVITRVVFGGHEYDCGMIRDISERRRTEEKLLRRQFFLDRSGDYPFWVDSQGRICDVTESTCRHLEYTRDELLSMTVFDIDPDLESENWPIYWERMKKRGSATYEVRHRTKAGRVFPVEVSVSHVTFGGAEYDCGFCRDISERKQVEEKLERAQFSLDNVTDYPLWVDAEGRIFEVSESTCRHLEYTRDELLSMTVFDIDPGASSENWPDYWKEAAERSPFVLDIQHRTKNGRVYPVEAAVVHVSFGGNEYDCAFCRDISERKQVESRLRRTQFTVDSMSDYPVWTDLEGRIVEVGESACRQLGYSRDEFLDMTVFDLNPRLTKELWAIYCEAARQAGSRIHEAEHQTKSGETYPVEISAVFVSFGSEEYVCSFCRNISERKRAEEKLERAQFSLDHMTDYPIWVDSEARLVEVSESTCRHLEYTREELLSMTVFDIDPALTPERWSAHWQSVRESGARTIEARHRTKSGGLRPVEIAATHVSFGGEEYDCDFCRDISERKELELSLRLNRLTVEQSLDMVFWMDRDGRLVYANESACRMAQRSLEEMLELHAWDLDPSVSEDSWAAMWQQTSEYGPFQHEGLLLSADDCPHPVEISSYHVEFEGRELGVAFARDISERRRADQVLRDSEERYRQLFELESDAIVLADDESGRILDVNPAAGELYGYSREDLLRLNSADLSVEPEPVRLVSGEPDTSAILLWNRKKDGTVFPAEVRHTYFELEGRKVRVAVVRDVTERLKAEEQLLESRQMLQLVLDTVPLRIIWKDRDLRYMGCNRAMALDLRLPDPSAIAGLTDQDLSDSTRTGLPPSAYSDDLEVIRTGIPKLQYEETTAPAEGSPRIIRSSKVPLRDAAGEIIGLLAVHEDVTERTMTLRALRERDDQLRHSQKMEAVGRLAGGIAHDFNNVLTTIIGYSDLILGSPEGGSDPITDDVREIKAAAERAGALTKQILAFSRRQSLRPEVISLNRIVSDIERMLTRTIGADIQLTTILDPDLGLIDVDEHQFVQIMLNLAVNARDAMPHGGTLTVETANVELDEAFCRTHPDAQMGSCVKVTVNDTGTGMDEETLAHVFEPFYTTKDTGEGTGLGLATVYGVVAQSGGHTYVESELGRGTTFSIYLPRVHSTAGAEVRSPIPAGLTTLDTILVVDDDDSFRALTVRILEKRGYRTIPASDGDQAVEILQNPDIAIDLLLTDIVMPGSLQGDQVGQIAAGLRPGLPILYMSSYSRDTIAKVGPFHGEFDYLEKPFTADHLVQRIRACLGRDQADVSNM